MIERTIEYLPTTEQGKILAIEYAANILYRVLCESGVAIYETKDYDPLTIEMRPSGNVAHSYVFEFEDGGRHHPFRSLEHLEQMLVAEGVKMIRTYTRPVVESELEEIEQQ